MHAKKFWIALFFLVVFRGGPVAAQDGGEADSADVRLGTIEVTVPQETAATGGAAAAAETAAPQSAGYAGNSQGIYDSAAAGYGEADAPRWGALGFTPTNDTTQRVSRADMERKTAVTVWDAVQGVPGVTQQESGGRNEGTISIRGSTRYQVGMYVDDIPVATAYRNEWDANNNLLYDLESVDVSKGYSSPLLASNNNLSGVVNLRTAKPKKKYEGGFKYLNFFDRNMNDQGRLAAATFGSKQEKFYLKGTVIQNEQDFFTLPSGFKPGPYEDGGRRENSQSRNRGLNLLAGFTPNENVDIMFGFVRQIFKKEQPFDAAQSYTKPPYPNAYPYKRFWTWPEYETTRYYMNAKFQLTDKAALKTVVYYDRHEDRSIDYTNELLNQRSSADKTYDQFTAGGHLVFDYAFNDMNAVALSAGFRRLSHKEYNDYGKWRNDPVGNPLVEEMVEDYWDFGGEYTLKPIERLSLVLGASYSRLTPDTLKTRKLGNYVGPWVDMKQDGLEDSKHLFNYQAGVFFDLAESHQLFATFARKSRFASMRERFYRTGGVPTNPDLDPERAAHYEVGYRGSVDDWLNIGASLYYSDVKDMIKQERNAAGTYFVNLDRARFYGIELSAEAQVNRYLRIGASLSHLKWKNRTNDDYLTGLPETTSTVYAVVQPVEKLSIIPQVNVSSHFYWNKDSKDAYFRAPGYATADLKAVYDINDHFSVEAGAKNIFDKEYALSTYYPQQGRNFFLGISGKW